MIPKKILHITSVLNYGGIETLILNVFQNIDREKISFDFLTIREDEGILEEKIRSLGGTIYKIPAIKKVGYFKFKKNLDVFFKTHPEYRIVHSHVNSLSGIVLECAKKHGVTTRIAHSHSAYPNYHIAKKTIHTFLKRKLPHVATDFFACSKEAGKWLFGDDTDFIVVKNGVDTDKFLFSSYDREAVRKSLNIQDKFVITNVGRFSKEKNHFFLLSVFKEILKVNKNAFLICVGAGKLKKRFQEEIEQAELKEHVLLPGLTDNTAYYLNASDVYVSPSLCEGFGCSVAEAQVNSLPCVLSDKHPVDINFTGNCTFLSCSSSPKKWADTILKSKRKSIISGIASIEEHDLKSTTNFLFDFYSDR